MTNPFDSLAPPIESSPNPTSRVDALGPNELSDLAIDTFRSEAAEAGDLEAVALCDRALQGDGLARAECAARILALAAASHHAKGSKRR